VRLVVMGVRAVFLVGFMASGKSTVGPELARRLDWDFVDLDTKIEDREGQTIPEIFRTRGEAGFRGAETESLRYLLAMLSNKNASRPHIVALGGGAFVQEMNRKLLEPWPTVFLEAPADELWQRSLNDGIERPLRRSYEEFARLYSERLPFYRQAKVTIVTSGKAPSHICAEIEDILQIGRKFPESAIGESQ
jgi:shikimate kinase